MNHLALGSFSRLQQVMPERASVASRKIGFIDTMDCLPVSKLPEGPDWTYEIKLDGYRLEAVRADKKVTLYSRKRNVLNDRFEYIATALEYLPAGTLIDGEVVGIGADGHADFYLLQKSPTAQSSIVYYVFDILAYEYRDLTRLPLAERRQILAEVIHPNNHVALSVPSNRPAHEMLTFARQHRLEGLVAKRADGVYQPGQRTGLWSKYRIHIGQEFVIGGYVPSHLGVDQIVVGFYRGKNLIYSARVRAGFVPKTRQEVFESIQHLKIAKCPFANLPETEPGRWGQGLTAEKMKECVWVNSETIAQVEFLEWTDADHLRHARFVRLRDDKGPREVVKEI